MKQKGIFFWLILSPLLVFSQIQYGGWRVHLPYYKNLTVTAAGSRVYCGSNSGLFELEREDGSVRRLSKITGLSDVEVKIAKYYANHHLTLVVYDNTNIDIIDEQSKQIYNIPDVYMKSIIGGKSINGICFYEDRAYLACSFGIVVLDLTHKRIMDSYQNLGPNGSQLEFLSISIYKEQIVASAANGVYAASLNAPNLNDFNFWKLLRSSTLSGNSMVYKGNLFITIDSSLLVYDGITWQSYAPAAGMKIKALQLSAYGSSNPDLLIVTQEKILIEKGDLNPVVTNHNYRNDAVYDVQGYLCMVDDNYGLTIDNKVSGELDYVIPNGPASKTFGRMMFEGGRLWVAGGYVNDRWDPLMYNGSKFYQFSNQEWYNFKENEHPAIAGMSDFLEVKKHPYNNEVYLSSFGSGVIQMVNNQVTNFYNEKNSSLQRISVTDTTYKPLLAGGMDFDNLGNLWVSNYGVNKPLSVKTSSGWYSFSIGTLIGGNELGWLTCDDYNGKWVITLRDKGILVYNDNGTPTNISDDKYKLLTKEVGQGALPSNTVLCVSKDLRGEMWIGTNQGLTILSNPALVFNTDDENFDARPIVIQVGSNYELFLGKEQINCIKVDAANRKWIGTPNGVWLVSADGYKVIKNFTTANSPLLSNNVIEIGIDESTGEVFFGTEKGIISYMGDATEGMADFSKVEIYPNPVRPDFTGSVSIRGLMEKSVVKITDIAGNLVYETVANGGFVSWDGKNYRGKRVNTGVYIVFASSKLNEQTFAGKILFIQ